MATIGLKDLYMSKITMSGDTETYGTPVRLAKAITASMAVETAEEILYADDGADEVVKEFVSCELTLGVNDLAPSMAAELLGQTVDTDGVVYAAEDDVAPYVAIAFRAKKPNGKYKYVWMYKGKFGVPDEEYETKGDGIEFKTPEIKGVFVKRPDGRWKCDAVLETTSTAAQNWFTVVREPAQ